MTQFHSIENRRAGSSATVVTTDWGTSELQLDSGRGQNSFSSPPPDLLFGTYSIL